jgi:hypothetical protein
VVSWQELLLKANMEEMRCAMPRSHREPLVQVTPSLPVFMAAFSHVIKVFLRAGRVTQVVEHLPSKCETLSSNPSTMHTQKKCSSQRHFSSDTIISHLFSLFPS